MKKKSFWNKNEQNKTINKEVITKKNFDEQKKIFVLIYNFLINGSSAAVFGVNVLAIINFMG